MQLSPSCSSASRAHGWVSRCARVRMTNVAKQKKDEEEEKRMQPFSYVKTKRNKMKVFPVAGLNHERTFKIAHYEVGHLLIFSTSWRQEGINQ